MRPELCPQCGVHTNICVCDCCQPITGTPPLWLLQDRREAGHHKGTARIAEACLPQLTRLVETQPNSFDALARHARKVPMALLYPTADSRPLDSAQASLINEWILLDGTWKQAYRLFQTHTWLQALPQFHFQSPPPSGYRIRKRPGTHSLATAEALNHLLAIVAPHCDTRPLSIAMEALVNRQLAQMPPAVRRRYD